MLSSFVAVLIFGAAPTSASIDNFLSNAVIETNGGSTLQTSEGTILYGGGFQMRAPTVTLQPFQISSPKIRGGCGGIDATFGALSFLNVDQIVAFLEGIMANAPGVMFDLALKVICPACSETLGKMEQLANQINGINGDSCQATKAMSGAIEGMLSDDVKKNGLFPDFNKAAKDFSEYLISSDGPTGWVQKSKNFLSSMGCNTGDPKCGARFFLEDVNTASLLEYALTIDDTQDPYIVGLSDVSRTLVGDVIKIPAAGTGANSAFGSIWLWEPQFADEGSAFTDVEEGYTPQASKGMVVL